MNINQARDYFSKGIIAKIYITPAVLEEGYQIVLHEKTGFNGSVLETAIGKPKVYKSLNSANSDIMRISGSSPGSISFAVFTNNALPSKSS
jgi:hypothetical protein